MPTFDPDIDWKAPRPTPEHMSESLRTSTFTRVDVELPETRALVDQFRGAYANGGALSAVLEINEPDTVYRWFVTRNRLGEYDLASAVVDSPALDSALPELGLRRDYHSSRWKKVVPVMLAGDVARQLSSGGAHSDFDGRPVDALRYATRFVHEVIGENFEGFSVQATAEVWSRWFGSPVWSRTWIVVHNHTGRCVILIVSDMD